MQNENSQLVGSSTDIPARQLERIANLLGLLVTHGKPQLEQIAILNGAGYNSVFVVHGRNEAMRRAFFSFLRAIGLQPIAWRRAIELTRKLNPYVGEILDAAFREAVAVIVLLTPDDEAKLRDEFLKPNDQKYEKKLTGQARPNVLFEAGMAMGRNPDSVVLVQVGDIRPFSYIGGRHVVRLSNGAESRQELITKLANAGCNVDASSGSDWLKEGDFHID